MTTTRIYRSTDSGAPVLTGQAGSLLNLLDKCLVDGYGSKTAAGWSRAYTGTNKAAYRNSVAAGGTGMYLRVLDDGSGTGGAREALVRCYLTMSDVDTGTIETPTAAQVAASIVWRKSNTLDSTARAWILVADELTMYLCVSTGTLNSNVGDSTYGAGDIASHVPGDAYRFFVSGRESQAGAGNVGGASYGLMTPATAGFGAPSTAACTWLARGYAGTGSPTRIGLAVFGKVVNSDAFGTSSAIARPSPGSSLSYFYPAIIAIESSIRGQMRGLYVPQNDWSGVAAGFEVVDPPGLTGTLMALRHNIDPITYSGANDAHVFVDITNAWPA